MPTTPYSTPDGVHRARWVFPVVAPPIEDGVVEIAGGKIVAVRRARGDDPKEALADRAILPALVNAHTHLEFSDLTEPLGAPRQSLAEWIPQVVARRRRETQDADAAIRREANIRAGLAESHAGGVGVLGEIATEPWSRAALADSPLAGVAFLEVLALTPERERESLAAAEAHLTGAACGEAWRHGLSPHAPYTVSFDLTRRLCELAARHGVPVAMHVGESLAEWEMLQSHTGALVEMLQRGGWWRPGSIPRGGGFLPYLEALDRSPRALVVHGNLFAAEELEFLARRADRMTLVACPRTCERFLGDTHPLVEALAAGVHVALGTDSRATNPDLSLWDEMRHVFARYPQVSPEQALRLGTRDGAVALGLGDSHGGLFPGATARLVAFKGIGAGDDPHESLFATNTRPSPMTP